MPLKPGEPVGTAIKELYHNGSRPRSRDQMIAIAESNHRRHLAFGGPPMPRSGMGLDAARPASIRTPHLGATPAMHRQPLGAAPMAGMPKSPGARLGLAQGGFSPPAPPFYERAEMRDVADDKFHPGGLIQSDVAGRSDRLPYSVAADSFVMPADTVSGLGSGNTLAGAKIMDAITSTGPFGTNLPKIAHGSGPPKARLAAGGAANGPVSHVMLAGGEYLITRDRLIQIGKERIAAKMTRQKDPLKAGHEWARNLVDEVRKKNKKWLANAPSPKR